MMIAKPAVISLADMPTSALEIGTVKIIPAPYYGKNRSRCPLRHPFSCPMTSDPESKAGVWVTG